MKTLRKNLSEIGWVGREQLNGKTISNKCGRDFLYLGLNYLYPDTYNPSANNPQSIDSKKLFGIPVPPYLAWTQIQFLRIGAYLQTINVDLVINRKKVHSYFSFVWGNLFSRISYAEALDTIERCVDSDIPSAIDISLGNGLFILLDHVMFVYGYDEDNLYVIDTLIVPKLGYTCIDTENHLYQLPKSVIRSRWSKFGRVWEMRIVK